MTFALPLCPPDRIEEALNRCDAEIVNFGNQRIEAFAQDYLQYIRDTYMGGHFRRNGVWEWHFYDRIEEGHLANNAAEGANNRLRTRCPSAHPGIYAFAKVLGKETKNTANKMEQYEMANLESSESSRTQTMKKSRKELK